MTNIQKKVLSNFDLLIQQRLNELENVKKKPKEGALSANPTSKLDIIEKVDEYFIYTNTDQNTLYQTNRAGIRITTEFYLLCSFWYD